MPKTRRKNSHNFLVLLILILLVASFYGLSSVQDASVIDVPISQVQRQYQANEIEKIVVSGNILHISLKNGQKERAIKESSANIADLGFDASNVEIEIEDIESSALWRELLIGLVPFILIAVFLIFMLRQAQSGSQSALSFGKSRARLHDTTKKRTSFDDVAGCEEAKEELKEVVDFLKNPLKYMAMGAKIPRGVMLVGSPGTGKTLLARAVAGEANVPFFSISGSEFVEMFVGVGASRVRDLFSKAKKNAPCIVFVDEIDAVGRQRGAGLGGGNDEREQTLNQILVEMDGFNNDTNIIVMAATNRPDVLDPALLRPGRFDRRIVLDMPDIKARKAILEVHARNKPIDKNVNFDEIASQTAGFSGADLENLMNEAAILVARKNRRRIKHADIEVSIEKVMLGPERRSRVMNRQEKKITAYHETGHALVATYCKKCDPVQKVSIVSRGMALGVTWFVPDEESLLKSKSKFKDEMASMLGGYTAEKLKFKEVTTGASNDLEKAAKLARLMIVKYGMSSKFGPVSWGEEGGSVFLGRELKEGHHYSEATAAKIDEEVNELVTEAFERATQILTERSDELETIAKTLMKKETISGNEFRALTEIGQAAKAKKKKSSAKKKA